MSKPKTVGKKGKGRLDRSNELGWDGSRGRSDSIGERGEDNCGEDRRG